MSIKIGKYAQQNVFIDESKINAIAKKYPTSYLRMLECVAELLRHPKEKTENEIGDVTISNPFGKIVISNAYGRWHFERCEFNILYNI